MMRTWMLGHAGCDLDIGNLCRCSTVATW